jgi:hypothetical protein
MKKIIILLFTFIVVLNAVYAQRLPIIGVIPFEVTGIGVTAADAENITNMVASELSSWGTIRVVRGTAEAEYIIRGMLSRQGSNFVLSASTQNAANGQTLNEYREQALSVNDISIPMFCAKAVERVPLPNYLLGTWQSVITMPDGPVVCIIEFGTNRVVKIERYDTWEHRYNNALRYEGYGSGTYTYTGFANRIINTGTHQIRIDAVLSVNLSLEETLPDQVSVNQSGLFLVFNTERTAFEILNGMLPCGRNFDGPSVYYSAVLGFSQFTKIR